MRDSRNMTAICDGDTEELAPDQVEAARRTVCAFATDATDATELMHMLGIFPGREADVPLLNGDLPRGASNPRSFS